MNLLQKLKTRLLAFTDKSAWILILVGTAILGTADFEMLKMLAKWISFAAVVGGVTIFLSRVFFPYIDFKVLLPKVFEGNTAAGLVIASVVVFCSIAFYAIIYWAK